MKKRARKKWRVKRAGGGARHECGGRMPFFIFVMAMTKTDRCTPGPLNDGAASRQERASEAILRSLRRIFDDATRTGLAREVG